VTNGYLPRHVDRRLTDACAAFPIVLLDGPRAVGKTTTAKRIAASVVELPLDSERLSIDPESFLRDLPRPVLIDEWQLAGTELLWMLKRVVDSDPSPGRFILAGSVEPATYGPTYPLTGRAGRLVMRPMTAAELDGRGDDPSFLERVVAGERPLASAGRSGGLHLDLLGRTGFPAARAMPDASLFLDGYAALVAQRAGEEGRDASRLLNTLRALATLESQAVPDQRIWEAADINKATWKAYDDLLTRTHVTAPSAAFDSNRLKRLTSYSKRYLADTALALALAGVDVGRLRSDPSLAGRYLESYVLSQLRPQVDTVGGVLTHLRTGAGEHEVDAVVEIGRDVYAFEVKLGVRPTVSDARHLEWLRDGLGDRFVAGFVVHSGADSSELADRIWAVPIIDL
jgi:predicted AAA+ superfamily ATPase